MGKLYFVYILASKKYGTLYIGVTDNLIKRVYQHKEKLADGFSSKYSVDKLVHFKIFESIKEAIVREKQLKKWKRDWKINLIEQENLNWDDLYPNLIT